MLYLPHKVTLYKYDITKNEFGHSEKVLLYKKKLSGLFNLEKTVVKDLESGLSITKKFVLILKAKDIKQYQITEGVDEVEIFSRMYVVEKLEPIITFSSYISYYKLVLKEKIS